MASVRRSWFDRVWNTFVDDGHDPEGPFDYVARSSLWRGDVRLPSGVRVVASLYDGGDEIGGNAAGLLAATSGDWGNRAAQMAVSIPAGGHSLRLALGRSAYDARVTSLPSEYDEPVDPGVVALSPGDASIRYGVARLEWLPSSGPEGFYAGVEVVEQTLRAGGVAAAAPREVSAGMAPGDNRGVSGWVGQRTTLRPNVDLEGGVRVQVGSKVSGLGDLRIGPHIAVRLQPRPDTYLTVAGRRSLQHLQQVGPAGKRFGGGHSFGHAWTLGGPSSPALTTDILSAGIERRLDGSLWLGLNTWVRRVTGMTVSDPSAGPFETSRVRWVAAENRAAGVELQLRRWVGPVTGSATYSLGRSELTTDGASFPSPADRRHAFDLVLGWQAGPTLRLLGSLRAHSGSPYTRELPHPCADPLRLPDTCVTSNDWIYRGPAGAGRGPGYASVDLGVDWGRRYAAWGWGLSLRLNNVSGRSNRGGYRRTDCAEGIGPSTCVHGMAARDVFYELLPGPLPIVSARVWF